MKQRTEQRTFYGEECERDALEWICNMEKCFNLKKIDWKKYRVKATKNCSAESRCKVILKYK